MQTKYILEGLNCANCALKIEEDIKNLQDLKSASLNFSTSTLTVESDLQESKVFEDVTKIVKFYEPDVSVIKKEDFKKDKSLLLPTNDLIILLIGVFTYIVAILSKNFNNYLVTQVLYFCAYFILGYDVLYTAFRNITKGNLFDENFLMSLATVVAMILGDFNEAVGVMLFYKIGEIFQDAALNKSKKSIADLMDIRPDYANLKINDEIKTVSPEEVKINDIFVVKTGEKIPLDGVITRGNANLNLVQLTGESLPKFSGVGDNVFSGSLNIDGLLEIKATKEFENSTVSKIINLVENASSKKSKTENFITVFAKYYTPIVVFLAVLIATIPPIILSQDFSTWIHKGLVFLVISCPCALILSIPLSFFGGIGAASKKGILIKGSNFLEALNNLETVVFDKTGTLTKGEFFVDKIIPMEGHSTSEVLEFAAIGESFSSHPIAYSILKEHKVSIDKSKITDYKEIAGLGVTLFYEDKKICVGNDKLMAGEQISFCENDILGAKVYVSVSGKFLGLIVLNDFIKETSKEAINTLNNSNIETIMLTGDNEEIANKIGNELSIKKVFAKLLPHEKVYMLEDILSKKGKGNIGFVGDGINDAPVLARADIGFAMGGVGSDAAIEAADIVLMNDDPMQISTAIKIAADTKKIVWQNIIFALLVKITFMVLGAFDIATMWEAVFADVGVAVIAILNSMRIINRN